jgi:hypothetical protein
MWVLASSSIGSSRWWTALDAPVLQGGIIGSELLPLLVTLVATSLFYAITLHLAATFFIGDVPNQKSAKVGPVPATVSLLLGQYGIETVGFISRGTGVLIVLIATLFADALAISHVYELDARPTVVLTLLHLAFAAVLGITTANLLGLV